ncbi:hypothetical protein PRJ_0540 [Pseudomonas sp. XWY-1]|nr:hypothetical protein PRJ_0540 [Pseudomonas sp. XWY-1]
MEIGIGKRIERGHDGSFPWFANVTVTKVSAAAGEKGVDGYCCKSRRR